MIDIISSTSKHEIATVYTGKTAGGSLVEFVESTQPPYTQAQKWVIIISTLKGCPVGCPICDAGGSYSGKLTKDEIIDQIDHMVTKRYPDRQVTCEKFKIQFARMGEPAFNQSVLDVLSILPQKYICNNLIPSISTVAPNGCDDFLLRLIKIKKKLYPDGKFQMQFSIHSTDKNMRQKLIPIKTWGFKKIADFADAFYEKKDRKISLNFALSKNNPVDPTVIANYFSAEKFIIKLTPVNPTNSAKNAKIISAIDPDDPETAAEIVKSFKQLGYDVILSIGDTRENQIGSNCGMYISNNSAEENPKWKLTKNQTESNKPFSNLSN